MRPTFMGFETATRGLMANQKALDVVGNNVSNIGVTGYTRQRVDLVSMSINHRYTRYATNAASFAGQGAGVYGVSQVRDQFLDRRFREEYSDVGYYSVTSSVLDDLHAAMDEISPSTMGTAMTKFSDAWNEMLSKNVNEGTGAANLLAQATQIVQVFQQMSAKIDNVWSQQEYSLSLDVENVNSILERIALLNDQISHQQYNSMDVKNELYQPLELLDQRNVLLDQLAEYADIYYETAADGQVTLWMGPKDENNPPVVQGDTFETLKMRVNEGDGATKTVSLFWNRTGEDMPITSGALKGALEMLNGRGLDADGLEGETFSQGILYFKDKIDTFAKVFAEAFNSVIEEVTPDTGLPYDPPRYKALFSFDAPDGKESAGSIIVSEEWAKDSSYLISNLRDKLSDGDKNNSYAARAARIFEDALDFGEFQGKITDYISFYSVTKLSNDKAYSDTCLEAVTSISDTLLNQIQAVSGVSMEEEGVDMLMYQKAYDAMSRVFTTLDEMLDKLINGTGVVGR